MTIAQKLSAPFDPLKVSWRVGSTNKEKTKGLALAYVDARDVMDRLDDVCGIGSWQCRYTHAAEKTVCEIGVKVGNEWIWKANGAGDTDYEGEKGAMSDAFKRAAVLWGIGRYLYDLQTMWVEIEPMGRSYRIRKSELGKLQSLLGVKSSHQLKKEVDWSDIQTDLEADLLDAKTVPQLTKLYTAWDRKRQSEGWNFNFWQPIKERFTERKNEINEQESE